MEVKFRWNDDIGEGVISAADRKRVLEEHWVTAADFLQDIKYEIEALYNEVMERRNVS